MRGGGRCETRSKKTDRMRRVSTCKVQVSSANGRWRCLASTKQWHGELRLKPALTADPAFSEEFANAETVFAAAREAITVIAAANILTAFKGNERALAAADFVEKKRAVLKQSLVKALERASSEAVPADPVAKRRRTSDTAGAAEPVK